MHWVRVQPVQGWRVLNVPRLHAERCAVPRARDAVIVEGTRGEGRPEVRALQQHRVRKAAPSTKFDPGSRQQALGEHSATP